MDTTTVHRLLTDAATDFIGRRAAPGAALADDADALTTTGRAMADRFANGATLLTLGLGDAATDAQHIAVELVHPAVVGKRPLPALALTTDIATLTGIAATESPDEIFTRQLACLARPGDIALALATTTPEPAVLHALHTAHTRGLLTIALTGATGRPLVTHPAIDHLHTVHSDDRAIVKELHVTTYHLLWELVHDHLVTTTPAPGEQPA